MDKNNTINNFLEQTKGKKVVLFGAGNEMLECLETIIEPNDIKVDYIVDNDFRKWYSRLWGYEIKEPSVLEKENKDEVVVLITSVYPLRIEEQLKRMNIKYYYSSLLFLERHFGKHQFLVMF